MGAMKVQTMQLPIEGCAAHTERPGCGGNISIGARKCPLQYPTFRGGKVFNDFPCCAREGRPQATTSATCLGNSERLTGRTSCSNDKIVCIDRNQGSCSFVAPRGRPGYAPADRPTKTFSLDPRRRHRLLHCDEIYEPFAGDVRPT